MTDVIRRRGDRTPGIVKPRTDPLVGPDGAELVQISKKPVLGGDSEA